MAGKSLNQKMQERKARGLAIPADYIRKVGNRTWTVRNRKGRIYTVCTDDGGNATSCNCADRENHYFTAGFRCKHMYAVEAQIDRPAPLGEAEFQAGIELLWGRR